MNLISKDTRVLIIGAGPSGLMMAAQLLRFGVEPIIIDSRQGPTDKSKALAVQARSLEIYRQMGLADEVLKGGKPARGLHYNVKGKTEAIFPINDAGAGETLYPYLFMYPQSKNERALLGYLTKNALPVYWNTTLTSFKQNNTGVTAMLNSSGNSIIINAGYMVGADGAHSTVRKQLNIPFTGDAYEHLFYLADVIADTDTDYMDMYLGGENFAMFFPTPEVNGYRIIGNLPPVFLNKPDVSLNNVLPYIEQVKKAKIQINELRWFTTYKLSHRMADEFQNGNCFLIGDAAHIHSPVGGQGMNTGLQDAYNLAWKLGGVVSGKLHKQILTSYAAERMPVARRLLKTTDRAFNIITSAWWGAQFFKKFVLPKMLAAVWESKTFTRAFFKRIAQIDISYRHSRINLHLSQATKIKAGDRLPYLTLYDEKKQANTDLHAWCSKPGFTMIILGRLSELELLSFARFITLYYGNGLNFFYLPPSNKNQLVFDAFEIKKDHIKTLVVRPDNYIGFMCDSTDIDIINNYLQNTAGLIRQQTK